MRKKVRTFRDYHDDSFAARVTGTLSVARSGVGFVSPDGGSQDIFIASRDVGAALPGDRVEVRLLPPEPGSRRLSGAIVRVVERGERDVVCTLRLRRGSFFAVPVVPFGGRVFRIEHPKKAKDGDRVVVRLRFRDDPSSLPEGRIAAVIGPESEPSLDTLAIEREYGISAVFPEDVRREAEASPALLGDVGGRLDLRDRLIVTIDPATAKDYDDALSLETDGDGRRVLGVHIADVSHFVRPGSALDKEARRRGTSVYLVDHVAPMLPEQLSNGVCSLVEGEDRLAFSAFLTFDERGRPVARRFAKSVIRSRRRMTYGEALDVIEGRAASVPEDVRALVLSLNGLSQQLRRSRFDRFSLDLESNDLEIDIDGKGRMTGIHPAEHNAAHELVEEAMIAANEAVATEVAQRRVPHLARFHDAPAEERLESLSAELFALGVRAGALNEARSLARVLRQVDGTPIESYVSMLVLRSMKRAEYTLSTDAEGHFGLAKRFYSHFTSPIRRYPDLVMHRQLAALCDGVRDVPGDLRAIARECSAAEMNADLAERALVEIKKYRFLEEQLKNGTAAEYDALVVQVKEFGVFVEITDLGVGGMIPADDPRFGRMRYDDARGCFTGRGGATVAPGAHLAVVVTAVDFDSRHIDWRVV